VQTAPGNVVIFECCAPADGTSAARCYERGDFGTSRFKKAARKQATLNEVAWGEAEGRSDGASTARRHAAAFGEAPCLLDLRLGGRWGGTNRSESEERCPTRDPS